MEQDNLLFFLPAPCSPLPARSLILLRVSPTCENAVLIFKRKRPPEF